MTYLIDGRPLQHGSAVRGIGTYLRGLLAGFTEAGVTDDIALLLAPGSAPEEVARHALTIARPRVARLKRRIQPLVDPLIVAAALARARPAPRLYHSAEWGQPVRSPVPVVLTVHDLIPFRFPQWYPWLRREHLLSLRLLRRASQILADSQSTADDLVSIASVSPERVAVVPLAVGAEFRPATAEAVEALRQELSLTRPFLLAVGAFDPRKRIGLLAEVVAAVRREHDVTLVIVGQQGNFEPAVSAALDRTGLTQHVLRLGHISLDRLVTLYTGAAGLVFTSAYEGFGLPPLEAMACGTPVAVFANSSLPEVVGTAAISVRDGDSGAMAAALSQLLADPAEAARRGREGLNWTSRFTWQRTAELTLEGYRRALHRQ